MHKNIYIFIQHLHKINYAYLLILFLILLYCVIHRRITVQDINPGLVRSHMIYFSNLIGYYQRDLSHMTDCSNLIGHYQERDKSHDQLLKFDRAPSEMSVNTYMNTSVFLEGKYISYNINLHIHNLNHFISCVDYILVT